jgi:hypothetical protein
VPPPPPVKHNGKPKQKQILRPYTKKESSDQKFDVKNQKKLKQIV